MASASQGGKQQRKRGSAAKGRSRPKQLRRAQVTMRGAGARAVLIPLGAALLAGERLREGVEGVISTYSSAKGIGTQLRRFEKRGSVARTKLEREVRRTRLRLERQLRQRRREIGRRRRTIANDLVNQVESAQRQLERTQHWLGDRLRGDRSGADGEMIPGVRGRVPSRA